MQESNQIKHHKTNEPRIANHDWMGKTKRQVHVRMPLKASARRIILSNLLKIGGEGARHSSTGNPFQRAGATTKKA